MTCPNLHPPQIDANHSGSTPACMCEECERVPATPTVHGPRCWLHALDPCPMPRVFEARSSGVDLDARRIGLLRGMSDAELVDYMDRFLKAAAFPAAPEPVLSQEGPPGVHGRALLEALVRAVGFVERMAAANERQADGAQRQADAAERGAAAAERSAVAGERSSAAIVAQATPKWLVEGLLEQTQQEPKP